MKEDIEKILVTEKEIAKAVEKLGAQISEDYKDKNLLLVSVLKGSVVFMADLMRAITIRCKIDFMSVSSYGAGVNTSGAVKIIKDLDIPLEDYDILIVEDILDSGITLSYIRELLGQESPAALKSPRFWINPNAGVWISKPITAAFISRMNLWLAMGWIMRKLTATCRTSVWSNASFTRANPLLDFEEIRLR